MNYISLFELKLVKEFLIKLGFYNLRKNIFLNAFIYFQIKLFYNSNVFSTLWQYNYSIKRINACLPYEEF